MAASLSPRPPRSLLQFLRNRATVSFSHGMQQASAVPASAEQSVPGTTGGQEIVIPKKKKRDSLSVLRALASTVKRDPNSPHYKYMDDPYLIPVSSLTKRHNALARESGKKAARYMVQQCAQWFNVNPSVPSVDAFMPAKAAYTHTDPSEAALIERIEMRRVKDAIEVYRKIKQGQLELSDGTCRQFLELLCVYNGEDPPETMMPEEFYFRRDITQEVKKKSRSWKDDDMAERVFDELEEKTAEDQQNLIRGMARYLQTDKAFAMYDEMMDNKQPVDLGTFNELIRAATFHQDMYENKWKQVESLLMDMKLSGVKPNLTTFTNVLFCLSRMPLYKMAPSLVQQTLVEMKKLDIEPSLESWKHVITVFYPTQKSDSNMLYEVINYLQGKEFTVQQAEDVEFFVTAIKRCYENVIDVELAFDIDRLVNTGKNVELLGDCRTEFMYYCFFLQVVCMFETMDKIMEVYQRITPHLVTPNAMTINELLTAIELQDGFQHLPLLWTDYHLFFSSRLSELAERMLELMAKQKQKGELQSQFCRIAQQMLEEWNERENSYRLPVLSTGKMIGHLIVIAENSDDHGLAWNFFEVYQSHRTSFTGSPDDAAMKSLVTGCLEHGESERAVMVVKAMDSAEMVKTSEVAQLILESDRIELSSSQRDMLSSL